MSNPETQLQTKLPGPQWPEPIDLTKSDPPSPASGQLDLAQDVGPSTQILLGPSQTPNKQVAGESIDLTTSEPSSPAPRRINTTNAYDLSHRSAKHSASTALQPELPVLVGSGILSLHADVIAHVLAFLGPPDVDNLGLVCKGIRRRIATVLLKNERVFRYEGQGNHNQELYLSSPRSFELLSLWWRYGGLPTPVHRATFNFPSFDAKLRNRCMQITKNFFCSLPCGKVHIRAIVIHVGLICERQRFKLDGPLWSDLVHSIHRSGCSSLSITSPDIGVSPSHFTLDKTLLENWRCHIPTLQRFTLDSLALTNEELVRWMLAQFSNSKVEYFKMINTGFTPQQLDTLFCYFNILRLRSIHVSDVWLMSIVDLLQLCPMVDSIRFSDLAPDVRVHNGDRLSLPNLTVIEGAVEVLGAFFPLLRDTRWENFQQINVCIGRSEGPGRAAFDSSACLAIFEHIAHNSVPFLTFSIAFRRCQSSVSRCSTHRIPSDLNAMCTLKGSQSVSQRVLREKMENCW